MFLLMKRQKLLRLMRVVGMALILAVIGFYVLPKLFGRLWFMEPYEYQMKEKPYQKPLRVDVVVINKNVKIFKNNVEEIY